MLQPSSPALHPIERYPGFTCFKSAAAIHYPRRWQRDALIQAALDPTVSSIRPISDVEWSVAPVEFAFGLTIAGTDFAFIISETDAPAHSLGFGQAALKVARAALRLEPLWTTSRMVWAEKRFAVDPIIRYQALEAAGARAEGISLQSLLLTLNSSPLPLEPVLAMLAQGVLEADLGSGLRAHTMLSVGPLFQSARESIPSERLRTIRALR
ncbi:hypothetical protein [Devosia sp. FJ2-5-3]|uniref:hypothetical protein n=1 Tax=Devosia sp. FJ2-5-3 TaxID=2976680 RepID=UPI0023D7C7A4|nr:hypothetical protein [Devosia sp. FJ2-5-3]WEJ56712.1 hypothetical protein N0P34_10785 [Devosia sp. FJ2-5-3]